LPVPHDCHRVVQLDTHDQLNGECHHRETVHLDVQVVLPVRRDGAVAQGHDLVNTGLAAGFPDRLRQPNQSLSD
jgi:hypothetical protein